MFIEIDEVKKKVKDYKTLKELFFGENINSEVYLVKKGDELILEDEILNKNDFLKFIKVVSGG